MPGKASPNPALPHGIRLLLRVFGYEEPLLFERLRERQSRGMQPPWLTVIMPTFNGIAYLEEALHSIVVQADNEIEVILIDDKSTDRTVAVAKTFEDRLDLKIFSGQGGNWVRSTNEGLAVAQGTYVSILHQDDVWLESRARVLRTLLKKRPCALTIHDARFIDSGGGIVGKLTAPLPEGVVSSEEVFNSLIVQNFVAVAAATFDRRIAQEIGGLDQSLRYTADWDLWLRLNMAGPVQFVHQPLASFRLHRRAQTIDATRDIVAFRQQHELILDRYLSKRRVAKKVRRAAKLSADINVALASFLRGKTVPIGRTGMRLVGLGPEGWRHLLKSSRLRERVSARIRAGLHRNQGDARDDRDRDSNPSTGDHH